MGEVKSLVTYYMVLSELHPENQWLTRRIHTGTSIKEKLSLGYPNQPKPNATHLMEPFKAYCRVLHTASQ